jgi:hypothetical protein
MFTNHRWIRTALILGALVLIGWFMASASHVIAETSGKKLKKKLRRLEHNIGVVGHVLGEIVEESLSGVTIEFGSDDDSRSGSPSKGSKPKQQHVPEPQKAKVTTTHPKS